MRQYFSDLFFKFNTESLAGRDFAAVESHTCLIKLLEFPSVLSEKATADEISVGFCCVSIRTTLGINSSAKWRMQCNALHCSPTHLSHLYIQGWHFSFFLP